MPQEIDELFTKSYSKEYETLNIVISTGRSKDFLGKTITIKELDGMSKQQIDTYFKIYELNYSEKVSNSLNGVIISLYSYAVNKVLPLDDVEKLQEDLNNSYILTNELKNITGSLARVGGKICSLVELSIATMRHIKVKTQELCSDNKELCKELDKEQCKELCNNANFLNIK